VNRNELLRMVEHGDAMGSTYSVVLYGKDQAELKEAIDAAFAEVARLDALLSNYRAESEWSEMNRRAAEEPVRVTPELFQLLSKCMTYSRESEGAFDIAVGPLMKLWDFYKGSGRLPSRAEVDSVMPKVGWQHVALEAETQTVRFDCAGVELDPGGIGKGYAVDCMVEILRRRGFDNAFVSGSESTMVGMGAPPEEPQGWRVGIKDPRNRRRTADEVFLKNTSLSTSGSTEKFFRAEGSVYSHIMDPRTGFPATQSGSVSVIAPHAIDSEVWAKPYFINGREWTAHNRSKEFRVCFCDENPKETCAWLP
jgi:thiamine biosynthesis lipoprotein